MTLWCVRFIPVSGQLGIDARFKTQEAARKLFDKASDHPASATSRLFVADDFGLEARLFPLHYTIVMLNTDKSMLSDKALNDANHDAARAVGMGAKSMFGSTVN